MNFDILHEYFEQNDIKRPKIPSDLIKNDCIKHFFYF